MNKIGVLTSGGDSPGMNAAIRAVVRCGIYNGFEITGIRRGYEGLIEEDFINMNEASVGGIIQRGGTILKTARSRYFMEDAGRDIAVDTLRQNRIDGLVIIGGDGSLRGGVSLMKEGIPVVGIPATIDNDLGYSDQTIGFDTAANTILDAISKIRDTSSSHERISVIEVMGRHCGDLALYAGITGGADAVLVPEVPVDLDALADQLSTVDKRAKMFSIVIKAEGVDLPTQKLADELQNRLDLESRIVVLGHIQRGGSPSARDRMLASDMGDKAVQLLKEGRVNKALGIQGGKLVAVDIEEALEMKRQYDPSRNELAKILSI